MIMRDLSGLLKYQVSCWLLVLIIPPPPNHLEVNMIEAACVYVYGHVNVGFCT